MSHTPAPWHHGNGITMVEQTIDIGAEDGSNVALVLTGDNVGSNDTAWANARLIAAAPELLSALTNLLALVMGECPSLLEDDHHLEMCRAAIAKAEGK